MTSDGFINVESVYEKNEELKREDVQLLQEWVAEQPHLPNISELYLILFLHSRYYNIESTKECIDKFYTIRALCPDFFQNRNMSINTKILETALYEPLSKRTPQNYQIFFWKFIDCNPENMVLEELVKSLDMSAMLMLLQTEPVPGHIILIDQTGMTPEHVRKLKNGRFQQLWIYLQDAIPLRLKYIIFVNVVPECRSEFHNLLKQYLKKELLDSLYVLGEKYDEIYNLVPKECFPSDLGGNAEPISELIKRRNDSMLAHQSFFIKAEKEISNELKRVGKPKTAEDVFVSEAENGFCDYKNGLM